MLRFRHVLKHKQQADSEHCQLLQHRCKGQSVVVCVSSEQVQQRGSKIQEDSEMHHDTIIRESLCKDTAVTIFGSSKIPWMMEKKDIHTAHHTQLIPMTQLLPA